MQLLTPLPTLCFPHDFDPLTITDCPTGEGQTISVTIEDEYGGGSPILEATLTPTPTGEATLYDLSSTLIDYLEGQTADPTQGAPLFLGISVKADGTELASCALIPCRHRLSFPASELLSTRFLSLQAAAEGPLPVPQGSAAEQPLSFIEKSDGTNPKEELPIRIAAAFAPTATGGEARILSFSVAAHLQNEMDETGFLLYRANLCPGAILDAVPEEDRPSIQDMELTAYIAFRGRRRASFLCLPPSLCLDDEGPRSLLFLDCFMQPQVLHFFGSSTLTLKPTFNALTTPSGQNLNYLIEAAPTLKLSSGPIISQTQRTMLRDIATARHIFRLPTLEPLTLTDTDLKLQPTPGEPLTASITLRRAATGQAFSPSGPAKTFDQTFDKTYL